MAKKIEISAVDFVRQIRDEQAAALAGKSDKEIVEFFREAGQVARRGQKGPNRKRKTQRS